MPLGPKLVCTISAIIFAAAMLFYCASLPLVWLAPSLSKTTGIFADEA